MLTRLRPPARAAPGDGAAAGAAAGRPVCGRLTALRRVAIAGSSADAGMLFVVHHRLQRISLPRGDGGLGAASGAEGFTLRLCYGSRFMGSRHHRGCGWAAPPLWLQPTPAPSIMPRDRNFGRRAESPPPQWGRQQMRSGLRCAERRRAGCATIVAAVRSAHQHAPPLWPRGCARCKIAERVTTRRRSACVHARTCARA